ncbi:MAG: hypothetical protein KKH94_00130 [Candidatus Omnitrophica bacterium]|nr:hypothetical protein [Candidatus Omnitrophota bacterium]
MITCIRKCRIKKSYKTILRISIWGVALVALLLTTSISHAATVISAQSARGEWIKGDIAQREAIFIDKTGCVSEVSFNVPRPGKYQLFTYLYHNWRKSFPCIYVKIIDSKGKTHFGYHKIENIWYLEQEKIGRWFFVSLMNNTYLDLPAGPLQVKFWIEGQKTAWEKDVVPIEDIVAVESFFLSPIVKTDGDRFLPWMSYPEVGSGDWDRINHHSKYGTDLITTHTINAIFTYQIQVPVAGYYHGVLSVLSPEGSIVQITIKKGFKKHSIPLTLRRKEEWQLVDAKPLYLKEGTYDVTFKNLHTNKIMIDYFFLFPIADDHEQH